MPLEGPAPCGSGQDGGKAQSPQPVVLGSSLYTGFFTSRRVVYCTERSRITTVRRATDSLAPFKSFIDMFHTWLSASIKTGDALANIGPEVIDTG